MIVQCQNCGAPLNVRDDAPFIDCNYCGKSNKVKKTRTLMAVTPQDWQPPSQWTDADRERAQKVALAGVGIAAATTGLSGCVAVLIGVIVLVTLGAGAAVFVFLGARDRAGGAVLAPRWDGSTPFRCSGTDNILIERVTANLPNDVAITVAGNCELTLIDSNITARVGIEGHGNGTVHMRNSTLRATETGVSLSLNQDLEVDGGEIVSSRVGVDASGNSGVTLRRGRIEGSPAVRTSLNAEFANLGGEVVER